MYKRMYVYAAALEATAPTVLMVWLRACLSVSFYCRGRGRSTCNMSSRLLNRKQDCTTGNIRSVSIFICLFDDTFSTMYFSQRTATLNGKIFIK
jgi:hypothetical protein